MSAIPVIKVPRDGQTLRFQSRRAWRPEMSVSERKQIATHGIAERAEDLDKFLRAVVDACASNVVVLDESGTILYSSKAWRLFERANGLGNRQHSASPNYFEDCRRFTGPSTETANVTLRDDIHRILAGEEKEFHRRYCYHGPTEPRHFVTHAARLNLPGSSSAFRVLVTHDDVGLAKEALRQSEERLSKLLETTKIFVWEAEPESRRFTYVSKQAVEILGYSIEQWCEPDFLASHVHRDDKQRALSFCQEHSQLANHYDLTFRMLARNDRVVWLQNLVSVTYENGKPAKMHGFMVDISARKRAEEALQALGMRLIAAQEDERRRVARELHDDFNQRMALLSIELAQLEQDLQKPHRLRGRLTILQRQAQEISADIHRLSHQLHPAKLDHLGLGAAVKSLCEELSRSRNLRIELKQTGFPATLPKDVTLCAFRIVQEALRNSVRHSGAQTVQVVLKKTDDAVRLYVSDDGCGFDIESDAMKKGLGFISMKERLHLVGGDIQIDSQPLGGTCIEVSIPLPRDSGCGNSKDEKRDRYRRR